MHTNRQPSVAITHIATGEHKRNVVHRLHHAGWVGGIDSRAVAEAPGSGQKESRIRIDIIIIMVAIGVGLAKHRDLVCFGIFDFWRSGEVCWIAVRSVILLIGGPFFGGLPKTAFQLRLHLTNVRTARSPRFWRCLNVVATLLCVDSCLH